MLPVLRVLLALATLVLAGGDPAWGCAICLSDVAVTTTAEIDAGARVDLAEPTGTGVRVTAAVKGGDVAGTVVPVAVEAVRLRRGERSLATTDPWVVAFAFGLLHGFGLARALVDLGLPRGDIPLALLAFNIGVESGQLDFIAAILAVGAAPGCIFPLARRAPVAAAYGIGTIAAFWCFERLDAMFF